MKRSLFQLFNLLMACVVLLSSTGFGLVEHSCQMRGKKQTVIVAFQGVQDKPGCATAGEPMPVGKAVVKKTECCQDDQRYDNVATTSSLSQQVAKFVKLITETVVAGVVAVLAWLTNWIFDLEPSSLLSVASPPFPSGRDILTLVRSLLL